MAGRGRKQKEPSLLTPRQKIYARIGLFVAELVAIVVFLNWAYGWAVGMVTRPLDRSKAIMEIRTRCGEEAKAAELKNKEFIDAVDACAREGVKKLDEQSKK